MRLTAFVILLGFSLFAVRGTLFVIHFKINQDRLARTVCAQKDIYSPCRAMCYFNREMEKKVEHSGESSMLHVEIPQLVLCFVNTAAVEIPEDHTGLQPRGILSCLTSGIVPEINKPPS